MDEYIKESIYCPISSQIFLEPVVAEDGNIYEKDLIIDWIEKYHNSPITRQSMSSKVYPSKFIKNLVEEYLKNNPKLKDDVYIQDMTCNTHLSDIHNFIKNKHFDKLLKYNEYDIKKLIENQFSYQYLIYDARNHCYKNKNKNKSYFRYLLEECTNINILKRVIDNSINFDKPTINSRLGIHYICLYGSKEFIEYMIDKRVSFSGITKNGSTCQKCIDRNKTIVGHRIDLLTQLDILKADNSETEKSELILAIRNSKDSTK